MGSPHGSTSTPTKVQLPYPNNNQTGLLEQVEPETEDDMDVRDFSERSANDKRPPKSPQKHKVMLQNLIPLPDCPDYMAMNAAITGIPKPQHIEIRGIHPSEEEGAQGMACLPKEVTPEGYVSQQ